MQLYPADYQVTVNVLFTDLNGTAVTPVEVRAKLYDGEDQVVEDLGIISFAPGATNVDIVILGDFNALEAGELAAVRVLRVEIETAAGIIRRAHSYAIEGEFRLALMVNSFQSVEAAELTARDLPNITSWAIADAEQRQAALITAYARLTRIPMKYDIPLETGAIRHPEDFYVILPRDWVEFTEAEFLELPADFRRALRRAQVIEANDLLVGDDAKAKQRMGILSETIGESSMMFKSGTLDMSVSREALKALSGYVYYNFRIARA